MRPLLILLLAFTGCSYNITQTQQSINSGRRAHRAVQGVVITNDGVVAGQSVGDYCPAPLPPQPICPVYPADDTQFSTIFP